MDVRAAYPPARADGAPGRRGRLRWLIAGCLALGVIITYFDRSNLSVATGPIESEYHISDGQMGILLSAFAWSYTVFTLPVAALLDRIGVKWLQRIGGIIWAAATLVTAVVSGFGLLILARVLLGVGEAPLFPAASKATSYWFPLSERSVATSSFDGSAKFSNVIGLPVIALFVGAYGWHAGFWFTGGLSVFFLVVFWLFYRDPSAHKMLSAQERQYIADGGAQEETVTTNLGAAAKQLVRRRKVWGLFLGFTAYNYCFVMFMTWLPGYMETDMHMSVIKAGWSTAGPWLAATIADVCIGGLLVDKLIRSGRNPTVVRQVVLCAGMLLGVAVIPVAFTHNPTIALVLISIALAGIAFSAPVAWSIPGLIAPPGTVGLLGGMINLGGNAAAIVSPIVTGYVAETAGFGTAFVVAGIVLVGGLAGYLFLLGRIEPITLDEGVGGDSVRRPAAAARPEA
ncbi:MAG TPA: MFS transporter [Trebonia sp.]|nr:MFS transporter [Trebonia sp.]